MTLFRRIKDGKLYTIGMGYRPISGTLSADPYDFWGPTLRNVKLKNFVAVAML